MSENTPQISLSFFSMLTLIFITLKLCGVINWSWWFVLSPILFPILLLIGILMLAFIFSLIFAGFK